MKILHFIPDLKAAEKVSALRYKTTLIKAMSEYTDVHILTADVPSESLGNVVTHRYPALMVKLKCRNRGFDKLLNNIRPDVVHIHACWNLTAYKLMKSCARCKVPVVLTVDRQLEPWHVTHKYVTSKLPRLIVYQRYMLRNAICLHAVNRQEADDLASFNWHPRFKPRSGINRNIAIVNTFGYEDETLLHEMVDKLLPLYQKVIDSNPFWQMTDEEIRAEDLLLNGGLTYGHNSRILKDEDVKKIASFSETQWRRILLHSSDQGILDLVLTGARLNGIMIKPLLTDEIARFAPQKGTSCNTTDTEEDSRLKTIRSDDGTSSIEHEILKELLTVILKIKNRSLRRSDLASLYKKIRFNNFDETLVTQRTKKLRISRKAARLLQILGERYGLEEGFMFAEPLNDKGTDKIRKTLKKSDIE